MRRRTLTGGLALLAAGWAANGISADAAEDDPGYPSRVITVIVPYPPGGIADTRARLQAEFLGRMLNQHTIVENAAGSSGILAVRKTAMAKADGYTLLSSTSSAMVVVPQLTRGMSFEPLQDLAVIAEVCVEPAVVMVSKALPFKTFQDVIAEAKRRPGAVTFASPGTNSLYHLCGEAIQRLAGVTLRHVPYRGAEQYGVDLMAGRVDMAIGTLGTYVGSRDQMRGLLIALPERVSQAPDIPTAAEEDLGSLSIPAGSGLFATSKTPPTILAKLQTVCEAMVRDPAMKAKTDSIGLVPYFRSGADFRADMATQYQSIRALIQQAGLKPG